MKRCSLLSFLRPLRFYSSDDFDDFLDDFKNPAFKGWNTKFQSITKKIDSTEKERKFLDNFFDEKDDDDLGEDPGIVQRMERLKEKQETAHLPKDQLKKKILDFIPKSPSRSENADGDLLIHGAEISDRDLHHFKAAEPPNRNKRREMRQERAEKKLLAQMEKSKMRKRKLYTRDVNDYPFTRRQLRVSVEYFRFATDALLMDNSLRELRKMGIQFDDARISLSMRKAEIHWSILTPAGEVPDSKMVDAAKAKLGAYTAKVRHATQMRMDMKWAPLVEFVYSGGRNPRVESINQGVEELEEIMQKIENREK